LLERLLEVEVLLLERLLEVEVFLLERFLGFADGLFEGTFPEVTGFLAVGVGEEVEVSVDVVVVVVLVSTSFDSSSSILVSFSVLRGDLVGAPATFLVSPCCAFPT